MASPAPAKPPGLTRRASLGAVSTSLRIGAQTIIGLLVTPFIVLGLGRELYGAWTMIQQIMSYVALADLRATGTVKFTLAARSHDADTAYKRGQIGACLIILRSVGFVILLAGSAIVWAAPSLIRLPDHYASSVRAALMISVLGLLVGELSSIPGNVLRGLNLEHKAMGLGAGVAAFASMLGAGAIMLGLGLPGLASAGVVGAVVTGIGRLIVVRRHVPWFGADRPNPDVVAKFWRDTVWMSLASLGFLLQNASDVLLAGFILGPGAAAMFASTAALLRMGSGSLFSLVGAANPGIAALCGQGAWVRVGQVRNELHLVSFTLVVALGVPVLLFNGRFVQEWLRPEFFAGEAVNVLLVALALIAIPLRLDTMLLDSMLKFRTRAVITSASSVVGLSIGAGLGRPFGLSGVAAGVLIGSILCSIGYCSVLRERINLLSYLQWMTRPVVVGCVLLAAAVLAPRPRIEGLVVVLLLMAAAGSATLLLMWAALNRGHRDALAARLIHVRAIGKA